MIPHFLKHVNRLFTVGMVTLGRLHGLIHIVQVVVILSLFHGELALIMNSDALQATIQGSTIVPLFWKPLMRAFAALFPLLLNRSPTNSRGLTMSLLCGMERKDFSTLSRIGQRRTVERKSGI